MINWKEKKGKTGRNRQRRNGGGMKKQGIMGVGNGESMKMEKQTVYAP